MGWMTLNTAAVLVLLPAICLYIIRETNIVPLAVPVSRQQDYTGNEKIHTTLSELYEMDILNYTGPESIVYFNGSLYSGVIGGSILRVNESGVFVFTKLSHPDCQGFHECGRPLGMRLCPRSNNLIVVDAFLGVFNVSLIDGRFRKIFPRNDEFAITFFNDVAILPNGSLIVSETSTSYHVHQFSSIVLEGSATGRLLLINPETGEYEIIAKNLWSPNGVQLNHDQTAVLVAETIAFRILSIPLDGSPISVFADGLPGIPDNIRPSSKGGYWVPVCMLRQTSEGYIYSTIFPHWPYVRLLFLRIYMLIKGSSMKTKSSMLLHLDTHGKITDIYPDDKSMIPNMSEVIENDGVLYSGSYFLPYIGRFEV